MFTVTVTGAAYDGVREVGEFKEIWQAYDAIEDFPHARDMVTWEDPVDHEDGSTTIEAHFELVPSYTIEHTATFTVRKST